MQVSVSETGGLSRLLEVAVPATEVANEVQQRLKRLSRTARLKGFRPGKAPLAVITKQFGEQVRAEVLRDLVRRSFAQAVSQEHLRPAGGPRRHPIATEPQRGLQYAAHFEAPRDLQATPPPDIRTRSSPASPRSFICPLRRSRNTPFRRSTTNSFVRMVSKRAGWRRCAPRFARAWSGSLPR